MRGSVDSEWNFPNFCRFLDELEVADDEDRQVCHHGHGGLNIKKTKKCFIIIFEALIQQFTHEIETTYLGFNYLNLEN